MTATRVPSLNEILLTVVDYYNVPILGLVSGARNHINSNPRMMFYYLARTTTILSHREIAAFIGRSDHSTVVKGAQKFKRMMAADPALELEARVLRDNLQRTTTNNGDGHA